MRDRPDYSLTRWNGWGAPDRLFRISDRPGLKPYLFQKLDLYYFNPIPGLTLDEISLSPTRLTEAARRDLRSMVGIEHVKEDIEARASHSVGKSYEDLVMARRGELSNPPDAVIFPGSAREVREILSWASENDVAVVPFGGGTSVVGGVEPRRGPGQELVIVLDLRRMNKILYVDPASQTAKIEPGIRGPVLEECLQAQGLTLGHFPDSFEYSTLGGWIATRSVGYYSNQYGRIEKLVLGLSVETPAGPLDVNSNPGRSAGPEVREFMVGSEGWLGVITLAEMCLHRRPEARRTLAYLLPNFEMAVQAVRDLVQQGSPLAMIRLCDEESTETINALQRRPSGFAEYLRRGLGRIVAQGRGLERPCLLLLGLEGTKRRVQQDALELSDFLESRGGFDLGDAPGLEFGRDRFSLPYLRDALIETGILMDTLETAVSWAGLRRLHSNVRAAIAKACQEFGARSSVNCHVAHAYSSGASLSFTFLAPVAQGEELRMWHACKLAATEAIIRGGGTLSHHHGIGTLHREWMMQEHGPLGIASIRSLKERLDPAGILNPGKLIP